MDDEMKWFASADLSAYAGKYIAIIGRKIVASGDNAKDVWNAAKAAYPDKTPTLAKIPNEELLILGFDISAEAIHEVRGVGETAIPVVLKRIELKLGEYVFNSIVAWALIEEVPPLLGRLDVFDEFEVNFQQNEKKVVFRR